MSTEIRGLGVEIKSLGVARGVVNNITQTIQSIQQAIQEAENNSGYKIKDVVVGIADNTSAVFNTPIISVETIPKRYWRE
jgi:cell division ATPase FtsA